MADTKVSALAAAAALDGTELLPVVQAGGNAKATAAQIKTFFCASPTLVTPALGVASATRVLNADGTAALPAYSSTSDPDTGLYSPGANLLGMAIGGALAHTFAASYHWIHSDGGLVAFGVAGDVALRHDGVGLLVVDTGTPGVFADMKLANLRLAGSTSGAGTLTPPAVAAAYAWTLPAATGTVALNPMTTGGDVIYGGASGAPTRLANGSVGQVLVSAGGTSAPTWQQFPQTTQTLTDAATVAWDGALGPVAKVTLGGNRTLAAPTNLVDGGTYILRVIQDGTGSRTLAYNAVFKWPGGTAPVLSTAINAIDILTFVSDGTNLYGAAQKAFA